jgi:hypothetical protein
LTHCFAANMTDDLYVFAIVALNILVQVTLIWRLKFPAGGKWKYCAAAIALPLGVMGVMRLLVQGGAIHARLTEQTSFEHYVTLLSSALLVLAPWLVTFAAIISKQRRAAVHAEAEQSPAS